MRPLVILAILAACGGSHDDSSPASPAAPADASPGTVAPPFDGAASVRTASGCESYPSAVSSAGSFEPDPSFPAQPSPSELAAAQVAMEGTWIGHGDAPMNGPNGPSSSWDLTLVLRSDGTYSAHSATSGSPAFFSGTDADCPQKKWRVTNIVSDGFQADIDVGLDGGSPGVCALPSWQGYLTGIQVDAARTRLKFRFTGEAFTYYIYYDFFRICAAP